ncbi:hypothetical protein RRG08_002383 [Elysia crispata]|uniref:Uncharacterized protein n=1 Tax=Elysia crispata TaxID=231223 RepID=A0AAE0ZGW4_9GAST|nr:hypothetical protein RRG08_002383 [Elysia crispata]
MLILVYYTGGSLLGQLVSLASPSKANTLGFSLRPVHCLLFGRTGGNGVYCLRGPVNEMANQVYRCHGQRSRAADVIRWRMFPSPHLILWVQLSPGTSYMEGAPQTTICYKFFIGRGEKGNWSGLETPLDCEFQDIWSDE